MPLSIAFSAAALVLQTAVVIHLRLRRGPSGLEPIYLTPFLVAVAWVGTVLAWLRPWPLSPSLLTLLLIAAIPIATVALVQLDAATGPSGPAATTRRRWNLVYLAAGWSPVLLAVYLGSRLWPTGLGTVDGRDAVIACGAALLLAALPLISGLDRRARWHAAPITLALAAGAVAWLAAPPSGGVELAAWLTLTSLGGVSLWYVSAATGPRVIDTDDHQLLRSDEGLLAGVPHGVWAFIAVLGLLAYLAIARPA